MADTDSVPGALGFLQRIGQFSGSSIHRNRQPLSDSSKGPFLFTSTKSCSTHSLSGYIFSFTLSYSPSHQKAQSYCQVLPGLYLNCSPFPHHLTSSSSPWDQSLSCVLMSTKTNNLIQLLPFLLPSAHSHHITMLVPQHLICLLRMKISGLKEKMEAPSAQQS